MTSIHINPDELHFQSHLMDEHIRLMLDCENRLQQAASRLDMGWQGGNSNEFINEFQNLQRLLHRQIEEYYLLTRRLIREADRWEENDQVWVREFRKIFDNHNYFGG